MSCCISQQDATIAAHIKRIIEMLKQRNIMSDKLSKIWENTDGCDQNYICSISLLCLSMFSKSFYVIIDYGINALGHGREVVDGLNFTGKSFLFHLMSTAWLLSAKGYYTQHYETSASDASLPQEFQKHLSNGACKHGVIVWNRKMDKWTKMDRKGWGHRVR